MLGKIRFKKREILKNVFIDFRETGRRRGREKKKHQWIASYTHLDQGNPKPGYEL